MSTQQGSKIGFITYNNGAVEITENTPGKYLTSPIHRDAVSADTNISLNHSNTVLVRQLELGGVVPIKTEVGLAFKFNVKGEDDRDEEKIVDATTIKNIYRGSGGDVIKFPGEKPTFGLLLETAKHADVLLMNDEQLPNSEACFTDFLEKVNNGFIENNPSLKTVRDRLSKASFASALQKELYLGKLIAYQEYEYGKNYVRKLLPPRNFLGIQGKFPNPEQEISDLVLTPGGTPASKRIPI